jgi:DNA-binding MarR family transcriptional regulator
MNSETAEIKPHEYELLNEIAQDALVTQSGLSDRLGIAVGSVNWYIKRLIHRGWIKVSRLDRTRLKYDLTSEGLRIFTQRAMLYARDSLKVYGGLRQKAKSLVAQLQKKGIQDVYLVDEKNDEIMDILRLTCIEAGIHLSDKPASVIISTNGQEYILNVPNR